MTEKECKILYKMGGRSGQSVRTGQRLGENLKTAPEDAFQRTLNDINRDISRERRLMQDLNERIDNATTEEERDKLRQEREDARTRLGRHVSERMQIEEQRQQAEEQQQQQQRQEEQRQAQERRDQNRRERLEQQQQQQQQRQQDAETYKDYNGRVSVIGTNKYPQYSTGDVLSFTGIPKDYNGSIRVSYTDEGAYVQITGEGVIMNRVINIRDKSVYNEYFRIDENSRHDGRGAEIFNSQVNSLRNAGFEKITVTAGGSYGSSMNGYYTWARFGYEPNNPTMGVREYNNHLTQMGLTTQNHVSKFTDIMKTNIGREWWKRNGRQWEGTFNLQNNSYSSNTMESYMQERSNR